MACPLSSRLWGGTRDKPNNICVGGYRAHSPASNFWNPLPSHRFRCKTCPGAHIKIGHFWVACCLSVKTRFTQRSTTNRFEREAQANLKMDYWLRWIDSSWFSLQDDIILLCQEETWMTWMSKLMWLLWQCHGTCFSKYPVSWTWQCQKSRWINRSYQHHTCTKFSFKENLWKGRVKSTPPPVCWERCRLITVFSQLSSQGLSSALASESGKMRDPGNEVGVFSDERRIFQWCLNSLNLWLNCVHTISKIESR